MERGRILKGVGGFYGVLLTGGEVVTCKARGRFRKEGLVPMVGDLVEVAVEETGYAAIDELLRGKTRSFARRSPTSISSLSWPRHPFRSRTGSSLINCCCRRIRSESGRCCCSTKSTLATRRPSPLFNAITPHFRRSSLPQKAALASTRFGASFRAHLLFCGAIRRWQIIAAQRAVSGAVPRNRRTCKKDRSRPTHDPPGRTLAASWRSRARYAGLLAAGARRFYAGSAQRKLAGIRRRAGALPICRMPASFRAGLCRQTSARRRRPDSDALCTIHEYFTGNRTKEKTSL